MSRILIILVVFVCGAIAGWSFSGGRPNGGSAAQKKVLEAYGLMKEFYVDEVNGDSLAGAGIQGMAEHLDPHTVYLEPEKVSYSQAEFDGNFDGIGIEFDVINDTLLVVTPLSGGPGAAAGISSGDRIITIDSVSAVGITRQEVLKKLRGTRGTTVHLKVLRPRSGKLMDFLVTRGKISTSSIDAAFMIDHRVGYIRLSRFIATTADEFRRALALLKQQGMVRLVIDLRGNPGGFLEQAVEVADEFLAQGELIVSTKSRKGGEDLRYVAKSGGGYEKGDLIVLVDKGSASASEILAGALQDNGRALVVGELSFGKGLVQRQIPFADGSALRMTVSRYYTPSGRQIQRVYRRGMAGREHYFQDAMTDLQPRKLFAHPDSLLYLQNNEVSVYYTASLPQQVASIPATRSKRQNKLAELKDAGGIIPDYWVTGKSYSDFYQKLSQSGSIEDMARKILDNPRSLTQLFRNSLERFMVGYAEESHFDALVIKTCREKKIDFDRVGFIRDRKYIVRAVKSKIAHQLFGAEGQLRFFVLYGDPVVKVAESVPVSRH